MNWSILALSSFAFLLVAADSPKADRGRALVEEVVNAVGSMEQLRNHGGVEYTYVYESADGSKKDVSRERYRFDGELSWAKYSERTHSLVPHLSGELVQGWDGKTAWTTLDGKRVDDEQLNRVGDFLRKTNFYWFAMMQKLTDPGLVYTHEGPQVLDGISYERVKVDFESGVGDVQDTYVLFIHPETKLVDRFLFTVRDFGVTEPYLMKVRYETVDGVKLPVERRYTHSSWKGDIPTRAEWKTERMKDIHFTNTITPALFAPPAY